MSDRYFIRRETDSSSDFEQGYWGVITDPDGKIRDRREEREQFLEDVANEISFLRSLPPGKVLDVGCGLGFLLSALGEEWEKHGVEVSSYAAEYASRWGRIHVGDLVEARYEDRFFDAVVMYHVIEHMPDPLVNLMEVYRVLRRGGRLVLATPDFDSGCARQFGDCYRLLHDRTHISLFDSDSVHRLIRDHGFVIDRVEFPYFATRHFTSDNLLQLFDTGRISPPFYGNFMTFFAHKPMCSSTVAALQGLGVCGKNELSEIELELESKVKRIAGHISSGGKVAVECDGGSEAFQTVARELFEAPFMGLSMKVVSRPGPDQPDKDGALVVSVRSPEPPSVPILGPSELTIAPENRPILPNESAYVVRYPVRLGKAWKESALLIIGALAQDIVAAYRIRACGNATEEGKRP